jgi:hypothetical protein
VLDEYRVGVGLDECAAAARSRGFPVFALQGYGQCFFGSMADVARLQASQKLSDESCSNVPCPASAPACGMNNNKVYIVIGEQKYPEVSCACHECHNYGGACLLGKHTRFLKLSGLPGCQSCNAISDRW